LFKRVYSLDAIDVDTTPPEVAGGITASNVTPISTQVTWSKAGDNLTLEGKLSYTVYTSTAQNLNSLDSVHSYGNVVPGQIVGGTSYTIDNLTEKTQYHAAVLVTDEAGNESLVGSTNFLTTAADIAPPAVTISSISPALTKDSPMQMTINFSESVTGFDVTDIDVSNASLQNFTGSGAAFTVELVPTSDGEVTAVIVANKAQDIAANGNTASEIFTRIYDSTAPLTPVITDLSKAFNSSFVTTLQQGVPADANFKEFRFTTDGTDPTCSSGTSASGATASVTVPAQTTTLKAIVCDEVGYSSPVASAEYLYDGSKPSVSISSDVGSGPTNHSSVTLTFTFSEPVNGFDVNDISLANASKGILTASSSTVYTLEINPTGSLVTADVAANVATDSAGNGNTAASQWGVTYDDSSPTVSITSDRDPGPTNMSPITLTFNFSEPVTGFDSSKVSLTNATKGVFTPISSTVYTLSITPASSALSASVAANSVTDSASNGNLASTPWSITYDSTIPTVAITADRDPGPTNSDQVTLTFTFSKSVTGFTASDVVVTSATKGAFTEVSSSVYTLIISPASSAVSANIPADSATDSALNGNAASNLWSITYDNTRPTVAITSNRDPGPTNNSDVTLTFTFSEPVTGFDASKVNLVNGTKGTFTSVNSTIYTLAITPTGSAVTADVVADSVVDSAGNGNMASALWGITYDNTPPTVSIASNRDPGPTNNSSIILTFTFSEAVTGFDAADVTLANATKGAFTATSTTVYTLAITPTGSAISASVAANSAVDVAQNGNLASTPWSLTYDNIAPTVTITSSPSAGPTNVSPITLIFTFSEGVTGFNATKVTVTNATKGAFSSTSSSVYTLAISPTASAVSASVPAAGGVDDASNNSTASSTWSITYDGTAPSLSSVSVSPVSPSNNQTPTVSFTLSEAAMVRLYSDGSCSAAISVSTSKPIGAQTLVTNSLAEGTYSIYIQAIDAAGNQSACQQATASYQVSLTPPGAPSNLAGTAGNASVVLTWDAPASIGSSAITDYVVDYSSNGGSTWTTFTDGVSATAGAIVIGLTNGTTYAFRVAAKNVAGTGSYSTSLTGIIPKTVPGVPTGVTGTAGDTQVVLTWTAPASNGGVAITDYIVQYSSDNGLTWQTFNDGISTTASATVTGLTNGTAYKFQVAAVNSVGQGSYSSVSTASTPTEALAPNPTGLTATAISSTQINLSWTSGGANTNNFQIAYKTGTTAPTTCSADTVILASTQGSATTASITGLTPSTQYSFRVCSTNLSNALSSGVTTTNRYTLAPEPTGLTAVGASATSMLLSWTSGGAGTNQYKIAYQPGAMAPANCSTGIQVAPSTVGSATTYTVTGLTAGTQYAFRVCATNTNSDLTAGITSSGYPLAPNPTGFTATAVSGTAINLSWTSGGTGTVQYQVAYQSGASAPATCSLGTLIQASTQGNATTAAISGLTQGTAYSFRVCATNTSGQLNSGAAVTSIYTLAAPAINLVATSSSSTAINLTWAHGGSGVSGYKIYYSTSAMPTSCSGSTSVTASSSSTSTTVTGLGWPYQYFFAICSRNANNAETFGATATGYTRPSDPTSFTSTTITDTTIALSWSSGSNSYSGNTYKLAYATGYSAPMDCSSGTVVNVPTGTTHTLTDLSPATRYSIRVCAVTPNGDTNPWGSSTLTLTRSTLPGEVTGLTALSLGPELGVQGRIQLSWNAAAGATGYQISYATGQSPPATCTGGQLWVNNQTSYIIQSLALGSTYSFRVCSSDGGVSYSAGATVSAVPLEPDVTNLVATSQSTTGIQLSWNLGMGGVSYYYKLAYQTGPNAPATCNDGIVSSGMFNSVSLTNLTAGTQYSFRVCAMNGSGASANPSAGVTISAYPLPPAPTGFMVSSKTKTSISLSWSSGGAGTNQYQIAYVQGSTPPADCISGNLISAATQGSSTTRTISGLSIGTEFSFALCSTNGDGVFNLYPVTTYARTNYDDAPNASGLTALGRSDSTFIDLTWTPPGVGMSGYKIAYQAGATAPSDCSTGTTLTLYGDNSDRTITGLTIGTQYAFRLCTLNLDYLPSSGITAAAYTRPPQPGAVTVSSKTTSSVNISWSSGGAGTSAYQIAYGLDGVRDFSSCTDGTVISPATQGSATTRSVTGLQAGTSYSFTVCSVNPDGVMNTGNYRYVTTSTNTDTTAPTITSASVTTTSPGTTLTPSVSFTSNESGTAMLSNAAGCSTGAISSSSAIIVGSNSMTTTSLTANSTTSIYVKATDAANNSSCTLIGSYIHDNTAPVAPVIADATKSFNAAFTTSIQQGVPADANFKEFRYTTNGVDPTCSTATASSTQPTSVSISAATTTLKAITCDLVGLASPVATSVYTFNNTPPTLSAPFRYVQSLGLTWSSVPGASSYELYWSTSAPVTTSSNKIAGVTAIYTHSSLTGGTPYYYRVAAVMSGVTGALSNEVSASPYTFAAPTVASISPSSGSTAGGTAVTITGTGFQSGATVTIGGSAATAVSLVSSTSITATTPAGSAGAQNVVVTNTDGQTGTLSGGFSYLSSCTGDCYLEGSAPNYAQDLAVGIERLGPSGVTMSLQFANGTSGFKIWKEKNGSRILNASGLVSNGWQQTLTRFGTAFSGSGLTNSTHISQIAGRVCPTNVFVNYLNMTSTSRCLYYDAGNTAQTLKAATGTEGEDRLLMWTSTTNLVNPTPGNRSGASYYEGNIKTCADKGMRLPVIYETNLNSLALPSFVDGVNPIYPGYGNGVPSSGWAWTASAYGNVDYPDGFLRWSEAGYFVGFGNDSFDVICVLPNNIPACSGDCYLEGSAPNYAQDLAIGTERQGPSGSLMSLQFANGSIGFKIWKEKNGSRFLNASGLVSNGWQQTLARAGTSFSGSDMTSATYTAQISGRVCPYNVFVNHSEMLATARCLYYDSGNSTQSLDSAGTGGTEGSDWLQNWNRAASGRGTGSSYFEGNIKTCADKGMRLPTLYETAADPFGSPNLPTGDGVGTPLWSVSTGVPSFDTTGSWTATANMGANSRYYRWNGASITFGDYGDYSNTNKTVRCVLPNNVVVTTASCAGDCYMEGSAPNYAQDLAIGAERLGPSGVTMSLQFANGTSGFKIWKEKSGSKILNATGLVANGWQKQLTRAGTGFSANDFTVGSNIAGRACPTHVFLSHSNMTASGRCLYYDNINPSQTLNAAAGTEAQDWLMGWNRAATGAGVSPSWFEGNIKTCADKGMRLPTLYETAVPTPTSGTPTDAMPTFGGSRVPYSTGSSYDYAWTASAHSSGAIYYWQWNNSSESWDNYDDTDYGPYQLRCVLP
jgi:hypothetical protein